MKKIKILLVDDNSKVRQGINRMLKRSPRVEIVGEAGSGKEALELVKKATPDIVLLDVQMPGMNGYEVARRLAESGSSAQVLALSGYNERQYVLGMFASGAVGYITKDEAPQQLIRAVQEVADGYRGWISSKVAEMLGVPARPVGRDTFPVLTKMEIKILKYIAGGKTDTEIGKELKLEYSDVLKNIQSIVSKLGVNSRMEAVLRAIQEGSI